MALITITRSLGCGGRGIAELVAEGLKIELFDDKRLQEEAGKIGIRSDDLKGLDEKAPGFFDRIMSNKPEAYVDYMEAVVYEVSKGGEGVILGHGSQILLRDFGCALHVLIHATEAARIRNLTEREGLSTRAAEKLIAKSDHEQRGFFRFAFHLDRNDPSLYDLVVNVEKLSSEAAAKVIMEAAASEEIRTCSLGALDAMERLAQTKRVVASLLKSNVDLTLIHVEMPEKGVAEISGLANDREEKEKILKVAQEEPGIVHVRDEISIKPASY